MTLRAHRFQLPYLRQLTRQIFSRSPDFKIGLDADPKFHAVPKILGQPQCGVNRDSPFPFQYFGNPRRGDVYVLRQFVGAYARTRNSSSSISPGNIGSMFAIHPSSDSLGKRRCAGQSASGAPDAGCPEAAFWKTARCTPTSLARMLPTFHHDTSPPLMRNAPTAATCFPPQANSTAA